MAYGSSASNASSSKLVQEADRAQQTKPAKAVDFFSFFDSNVPTSSSAGNVEIGHIREELNSAQDEAKLSRAAQRIFANDFLKEERRHCRKGWRKERPSTSIDTPSPTLVLNEYLLLHLLHTSFDLTAETGRNDTHSMDTLAANTLRKIADRVSHNRFSSLFLDRMARMAGSNSATLVLDQLLRIVQTRLATNVDRLSLAAERPRRLALSRNLLVLMRQYSHLAHFQRVQQCSDLLQKHSLPRNVFHFQYQLIALFQERTSRLIGTEPVDVERQSLQMLGEILEIKASMEANHLSLDDSVLATLVYGLSAPLRNPLTTVTSAAQATKAVQLVRTVVEQLAESAPTKPLHHAPRLFSALIHSEIDAIERHPDSNPKTRQEALERIKSHIRKLKSTVPWSKSEYIPLRDNKTISKARLAALTLQIRLAATSGDIEIGLEKLRMLLAIEPAKTPADTGHHREVILKQRSAVISLFSAAIQHRQSRKGQDAAFKVLQCAFSTPCFESVWSGIYLPANALPSRDPKAYDPNITMLRLWKRWFNAWSIDYRTQGDRIQNAQNGAQNGKNVLHVGTETGYKYQTFSGAYPWPTLKRGLRLLNMTIQQYENMHNGVVASSVPKLDAATDVGCDSRQAGCAQEVKIPRAVAQLASLFTERNVLSNIVRATLRGGRLCKNETMATNVERRLSLLVGTLTRIDVPARVWEQVESSMLRHLALIDRQVLPTSAVRDIMDEIDLRKRVALLRNSDLVRALNEEQDSPISVDSTAAADNDLPLETGSIFVLRQMLEKRAQSSKKKPEPATARAAFT